MKVRSPQRRRLRGIHAQDNPRWQHLSTDLDRGSATVELVVFTPLLVALLLLVVLCGRLVVAQLDLNTAAHRAARAASLARTVPAATADARRVALDTLATHRLACQEPSITVDTGALSPGGAVTVTITCVVELADLALITVPGTVTLSATSTSPVDRWRATARGFGTTEEFPVASPSGDGGR